MSYGLNAYMIFTKDVSNKTEKQIIAGQLKVIVKSIPDLQIEGEASGNFTENQETLKDEIDLKAYMDYNPDQVPTTYDQAIEVYQNLPHYARNSPTAVRFSLTPIKIWCTAETRLINTITEKLTQSLSYIKQELRDTLRRIETLQSMKLTTYFPSYMKILGYVKDYVRSYEAGFNGNISELVSTIRDGSSNSQELEALVDNYYHLPIAYGYLSYFLDMRKREIETADHIITLNSMESSNVIVDIEPSGQSNVWQQRRGFRLILTLRILTEENIGKAYLNATPGEWDEDGEWFRNLKVQGKIGELLAPFLAMARNSAGLKGCFIIQLDQHSPEKETVDLIGLIGSSSIDNFTIPELVCAVDQLESRYDELNLELQYKLHPQAIAIEAFLWNIDNGESFDEAKVIKVTDFNSVYRRRSRGQGMKVRHHRKSVVLLKQEEVWSYEQPMYDQEEEDSEKKIHIHMTSHITLSAHNLQLHGNISSDPSVNDILPSSALSVKIRRSKSLDPSAGLAEVTITQLKEDTKYGLTFGLLTAFGRGPKSADIVFETSYDSKPKIIQGSFDYPCHRHEPASQPSRRTRSTRVYSINAILFVFTFF